MRRAQPSELYQVDFVAALFGGFLLVWLSGMSEAEFPSDNGKQPVFFELTARAYYDRTDASGERWSPLLPATALGLGCAHSDIAGRVAADRQLVTCKTQHADELKFGKDESKDYGWRVRLAAKEDGRPVIHTPATIDGTPLEILLNDNGFEIGARFTGMALSKMRDEETANAIGLTEKFVTTQLGIIRDQTLAVGPKFIKFDSKGRLDTFMFVVPRRSLANIDLNDVVDTDSYYFTNMPPDVAYANMLPNVKRIEATLRLDKEAGGGCYRVRVDIPADTDRAELKPC
jgi:hypothetical protein